MANYQLANRGFITACLLVVGLVEVLGQSASKESEAKVSVEWQTWSDVGGEAREDQDRPFFFAVSHEQNSLSKAMEVESFANQSIARRLNSDFLPVRVDKNQHPILSEFLLSYVSTAKQIKDWPLNVITTPGLSPFEGGGYYPPTDDWGSQGLLTVVDRVAEQWKSQKEEVIHKGEDSAMDMEAATGPSSMLDSPSREKLINLSAENLVVGYDAANGGFGFPPKAISFNAVRLLDLAIESGASKVDQLEKARKATLDGMIHGAGRDHVRGGFFSTTIDETWSIPDFRKSVSTQADAIDYLKAYPEYEHIVAATAQALLDDFRNESGFYSEHIGTEGGETEAVVANTWTLKDLSKVVKKSELKALVDWFGITEEGNVPVDLDFSGSFEGRNLLKPVAQEAPDKATLAAIETLRDETRSRFPLMQESISSVSVNAIVVSSFAKAGNAFSSEAIRLSDAMLDTYWDEENGIVRAATRMGKALRSEASSRGYALFVRALLDVAEELKKPEYQTKAVAIQKALDSRFLSEKGAYLIGPKDTSEIPLNLHAFLEDQIGSANSVSVGNLVRLHKLYPTNGHKKAAEAILKNLPEGIAYFPEAYSDLVVGISDLESSVGAQ